MLSRGFLAYSLFSLFGFWSLQSCNLSIRAPSAAPLKLDTEAPQLAAVSVANGAPTDTNPFVLVYGSITGGTYSHYCILENDTNESNCSYTAGVLPSSYSVTSTNGNKTLSFWLRDSDGNTSNRVDTATINFTGALSISPTSFTATPTRGRTVFYGLRYDMGGIETSGGDLFVVGGRARNAAIPDAVFFKNTTHLWEGTPPMHSARIAPEVIELSNGKFLVIGGCVDSSDTATSTVELYDPTTGQWSRLASMTTARCRHSATLLSDGRILVAGGRNGATFHSSTEFFHVAANKWNAGPTMGIARHYHRAIRVASNQVYILGGGSDASTALDSTEIFNPSDDTLTAGNPMQTARMDFGAIYHTAAEDGFFESIHVIGGWTGATALVEGEICQVGAGTGNRGDWVPKASLSSSRRGRQFVKIASGGALAVGGWAGGTTRRAEVEKYDRVANTWTARANASFANAQGFAGRLGDGRVIRVAGHEGTSGLDIGSSRVLEFNDTGNSWTEGYDLVWSFRSSGATALQDGSVLECGGDFYVPPIWEEHSECYRFFPSRQSVSSAGKLRAKRTSVGMVTLSNGIAAIFGGSDSGARYNHLDLYNPATNTITAGANLPKFASWFTYQPLPGSKALIAGGYGGDAYNWGNVLDNTYVYDYGTNSYSTSAAMPAIRARTCHVSTPSGRVFVMGGWTHTPDTYYNSVWEYNVGSATWTAKASMNETAGRTWCSMGAYESGGNEYIIVAGGVRTMWADTLSSVERYDVINNTWTNLASMTSVTSIAFGYVNVLAQRFFVFGGYGGPDATRVHEYNMQTNSWSLATSTASDRFNTFQGGAVTGDGRVFLMSGNNNPEFPAEFYHFVSPQTFTASGGDKNYNFSLVGGGQGTVNTSARTYVPPFPLPGGSSTVRVTDGAAATADSTGAH